MSAPVGHRRPRWFVAVPALLVLLLVATLVLVASDEGTVAALEVSNAQDVTVTLADGSIVRNPMDGFLLREGAVLAVGEAGSVTIDDVTLGAGAVVTVRGGRLVADVVATTTTRAPASLDDPDVEPATSDRDPESDPIRTTTTSLATNRSTTTAPATRPDASTTTSPRDVPTTLPPVDRSTTTRPASDADARDRDGAEANSRTVPKVDPPES